ncbi:MAG: hypothetical protein BBJ57_01235 [Desulfobacterales bacterium PC51MH44]|nr:MAG: hypothetical protein BBJ57_01235 [Desulfobacterales bacterium PC51MH44]
MIFLSPKDYHRQQGGARHNWVAVNNAGYAVGKMAMDTTESDWDIILDSITEGVFTVDRYWRITSLAGRGESRKDP